MPASFLSLPHTLVEDIVETCLHSLGDVHASRRAAAALCLVSSSFLYPARKHLYRSVSMDLERPMSLAFLRTLRGQRRSTASELEGDLDDLSALVKGLILSTVAGRFANDEASRQAAGRLQEILASCPRLEEIRFTPDDDARNHDLLYDRAWSAAHPSLRSFTLVISRYRDLVLLPTDSSTGPLQSLTIELAHDGDLQWDYDILLASWPGASQCISTAALHLDNLTFSDEVMVDKLEQLCRAIHPPQRLRLTGCEFSRKAANALLRWAAPGLVHLETHLLRIADGRGRPCYDYVLPFLPKLQTLESRWTIVLLRKYSEGDCATANQA